MDSDNLNAPATKGDLKEFGEALRNEFRNDLHNAIHESETRLLSAFYSFARTSATRIEAVEDSDTATRRRLGTLEVRLLEVERRLNIPPAS